MPLWGVIVNAGILILGVLGVTYEHGKNRGIIEQVDQRLTRIEDFLFKGSKGD